MAHSASVGIDQVISQGKYVLWVATLYIGVASYIENDGPEMIAKSRLCSLFLYFIVNFKFNMAPFSVLLYVAFALSLFVPQLSSVWCLSKAVLRDCVLFSRHFVIYICVPFSIFVFILFCLLSCLNFVFVGSVWYCDHLQTGISKRVGLSTNDQGKVVRMLLLKTQMAE